MHKLMVKTSEVKQMSKMSQTEAISVAKRFEEATAQEVLEWTIHEFGSKVALASSFGAEDVVLIDMLAKLGGKAKVFTIDTGRLHQETYNVMDAIREKYGIPIEVYFPKAEDIEKMVKEHGLNLFYRSVELRTLCCQVRKVEPLRRALSGLDAWITGLRREQALSRTSIGKVEIDYANGELVKINSLADWSSQQVWEYIHKNDVPHNALFDQGYASIGCAPCTRPIRPEEDPRAGRWWWEEGAKECGLHWRFNV